MPVIILPAVGETAWGLELNTAIETVNAQVDSNTTAIGNKANSASPVLTGNPTAPTPATGDNDTSIATTAFVKAQGYAPLASPALTGSPTAPTPTAGDNDTSIATTAFVANAVASGGGGGSFPVATSGTTTWQRPAFVSGAMAVAVGQASFSQLTIDRACTLQAMRMDVTTAAAGSILHVGIWARHPTYVNPHGAPLVNQTIDASTTGKKELVGLSVALTPGLYWVGVMCTVAGCSITQKAETDHEIYDGATGRWRRDSFPDSSLTSLPTIDWGTNQTRGWASSGNAPHFEIRTT